MTIQKSFLLFIKYSVKKDKDIDSIKIITWKYFGHAQILLY